MANASDARSPGRLVILLLALAGVAGGAFWLWRVRDPGRAPAVADVELERRRVAALDPSFDPGKPAGRIEGIVRDFDGRPVDGAIVAATRGRGRDELPTFSRPIPRTTTTAGGGRFALADVLPGEYGITATHPDAAPARQNKLPVASGQTATVTLTLGKGGALFTGEVQDVGGGPVAGARALLRGANFAGPGDDPQWFTVTADERGMFKVRLAPGQYELTVRAEGYAPARDWLILSTPQTRRYRLNPAARLAGRVLDRQTGAPVPGASVWLRMDRLESFVDRDATSDGDGRFSFDDLGAGGYVVLARADQRIGLSPAVSVGVAQAVTGVEVFVEGGRSVRGKVVGPDGKGIAGARVSAGRFDPPFERPVFVKSGGDGAFEIGGLLPAKYRLNAFVEGQGSSKPETAQVTSKDVEGIRLSLAAPVVVRGQVLDAGGAPVAEATVTGAVETKDVDRRFLFDRTNTDGAGKFELQRLGPGKLTLTARHPERGAGRLGPQDLAASVDVTVKLEGGASISGTVKTEEGQPATRVIVWAPPAQMTGPFFGPPEQAATDDAGNFRLVGLEKGRYMVTARRLNEMGWGNPQARAEVSVEPGEQKSGVQLVIPNAGKRISGTVVGADGQPVSGALVTAGQERDGFAFRLPLREGMPSSLHAVSDHDGAFALEDVQDAVYTVWAADAAHADGETKGVKAGASGVTVRLQSGAALAGQVRTKAGEPVTDYNIAALPGGPPGASPDERMRLQMTARMWSASAQVHDPQGRFSIGRLSPGAYELTVTTADGQGGVLPVTVAAGEKKQGLTVLIDLGAKLTGRVVELDSGAPLEGVAVMVASATTRLNAQTGKDGSFSVAGLSPGRSRVDFRLGDGQSHVPEHVEVEMKPGGGEHNVGIIKMLKGSFLERAGNFGTRGRVGVTVSLVDGKPSVTGVIPGFPADKAGLKQGELVLTINGKTLDGYGNGALDYLAAGKLTDPLILKVQPREGGAPREVELKRVPMDYDPSRPAANKPGGSGTTAAR